MPLINHSIFQKTAIMSRTSRLWHGETDTMLCVCRASIIIRHRQQIERKTSNSMEIGWHSVVKHAKLRKCKVDTRPSAGPQGLDSQEFQFLMHQPSEMRGEPVDGPGVVFFPLPNLFFFYSYRNSGYNTSPGMRREKSIVFSLCTMRLLVWSRMARFWLRRVDKDAETRLDGSTSSAFVKTMLLPP